jgi:arylsulfatase A-like enzyme
MEACPAVLPHRSRLSRALPAVLVCAVVLGCAGDRKEVEAFQPNILIVVIDALRADRLGVDGYPLPTTPNIDALAAEGVYFSAALAHSTWTKPSIATLITSLYPSQHGIQRVSVDDAALRTETLDDSLVTLAERLQAAGYATGAVINQVHLLARFGFGQGYDHYDDKRGRNAFKLNGQLREWLTGLERGPFFAYVHYLDLHWPFTLRLPQNADAFGPTAMKSEPPSSGQEAPEWGSHLDDPDDLRALQARYDHEVAYTDAALGELVEDLRELGLYEDTLIFVTADHGEAFLEHGLLGHGFAPYEELLRVPLVARLPSRVSALTGRIERPVGLIDLMPTLLDIAGLEPQPGAQGESIAPLLRGEPMADRVIFADTFEAFSARSRTHKLIWYSDERKEFFDLTTDPAEKNSMAEPCRGACRELAQQIRPFRRLMLKSRESNPAGTAELNPEDVETLRALGYLD